MDMLIQQLNWRYATQQYDRHRIIPAAELEALKEAVRLTPTSYGLQPFKVLLIESVELRQQLRQHSYNQPQITDASHLMILASRTTINAADIDAYIRLVSVTRGQSEESLSGFGKHIQRTVNALSDQELAAWNEKQVYIALGQLLTAAAVLHIDATPMEGFSRKGYAEVLQTDGFVPVVAVALGYRSDTDKYQYLTKVRKSMDDLFERY